MDYLVSSIQILGQTYRNTHTYAHTNTHTHTHIYIPLGVLSPDRDGDPPEVPKTEQ